MSTTALVVIGAIYVVKRFDALERAIREQNPAARPPTATPAQALDAFVSAEPISGLRVDESGISIYDWGRWVPFARTTLRQAIMLGKLTPDAILQHMMQIAYPQYVWPPSPNSALYVDYQGMLAVLETQIHPDPMPETRPQLRVVK